jgi:hypothetical protein
MRIPTLRTFVFAAVVCAAPMLAAAAGHDPASILRQAKAAAGGAAWDAKTGSYEEGVHGAVRYKTWLDYRTYRMRSESEHDGVRSTVGFNGKISWRVGPDGKVTVKDDPDTLREAITTAYASNAGYFWPDRFPATFRYVREARAGGRTFDVIEVAPKGGRAFEVWFDRRTHLLGRIVDQKGTPPVWVEIKPPRRVGDVTVSMGGVIHSFDGAFSEDMRVASVEYRDVPDSTFDPPASPPQ